MATYTAAQLYGTGSIGEDLSGASTFAFTNPNDSSYFTLETIPNATGSYAGAPTNALGTWVVPQSMGFVSSSYVASVVVQPGSSSLTFIPSSSITGTTYRLRGTGTYGLNIGSALLLDIYSDAAAAYSLRKLRTIYAGSAIRVRRSSDNAESDIGFNSGGGLNTTALTTFVGAGSGFVTTWYDQSGNGRHVTQATATSQPRIVNAGTVDTQNGKPAMVFDGSDDILQDSTNNPFTFTGPISFVHASYKNSTTYKHYETLFSAGTTGDTTNNGSKTIGFGYANTSPANPIPSIVTDIWQPSGVQQNGTVGVNQSRIVGYYIPNWSTHRTAGQTSIRSNGVDLSVIPYGLINPTSLNTNPIKIGGYDTILPQGYFAGSIFEMVAYTSNLVASRIPIESNINSYYSIY
jgi:hypothetical protein